MMIGYARVSTQDQDTALQREALEKHGVGQIFMEKGSSVGARPELHRALGILRSGDVLVVWKIDRVARSLRDLLNVIERLEQAGAGIKSLTEPMDTSSPAGRLMLQMLGAVAEFERSLIRERSMAGQAEARSRGIHVGRPRCVSPQVELAICDAWERRAGTLEQIARQFGVSASVVKRVVYRLHRPHSSSLL